LLAVDFSGVHPDDASEMGLRLDEFRRLGVQAQGNSSNILLKRHFAEIHSIRY
jgi:hypothetical protein